jgi:hypothetical protein
VFKEEEEAIVTAGGRGWSTIADLDPFAYMDGVSALWFGPDNYSEVAFGYADIA